METDHLHVTLGHWTENIAFDITDIAEHEVILRIPWLRKSNPRIDWTTGLISWKTASTKGQHGLDQVRMLRSLDRRDETTSSASEATTRSGHMRRRSEQSSKKASDGDTSPAPANCDGRSREKDQCTIGRFTTDHWTRKHMRPQEATELPNYTADKLDAKSHIGTTERFLLVVNNKRTQDAQTTDKKSEEDRLQHIPEEYRKKYPRLFQTELEAGLPEHTSYDHEIPLEEGKTPKFTLYTDLTRRN